MSKNSGFFFSFAQKFEWRVYFKNCFWVSEELLFCRFNCHKRLGFDKRIVFFLILYWPIVSTVYVCNWQLFKITFIRTLESLFNFLKAFLRFLRQCAKQKSRSTWSKYSCLGIGLPTIVSMNALKTHLRQQTWNGNWVNAPQQWMHHVSATFYFCLRLMSESTKVNNQVQKRLESAFGI